MTSGTPGEAQKMARAIGQGTFNALVDELTRHFERGRAKQASHAAGTSGPLQDFRSGVRGEIGPAAGATLGAGAANMLGINPLSGAALGYGLGSLPEMIKDVRAARGSGALAQRANAIGSAMKAPLARLRKVAGTGVGAAMTTSQYSGPLSLGPFKLHSGVPAFRAPALAEAAGGSARPEPWMVGANKTGAATGAMHPSGRLTTTQRVGAPKVTGFSGPSIADVSKPEGFGRKLSGTLKANL